MKHPKPLAEVFAETPAEDLGKAFTLDPTPPPELRELFERMTTEDLRLFRKALELDLTAPPHTTAKMVFCKRRIVLLDELPKERMRAPHVYRPDHNGECPRLR